MKGFFSFSGLCVVGLGMVGSTLPAFKGASGSAASQSSASFASSMVEGRYACFAVARGGHSPGVGIAHADFDGTGDFTFTGLGNVPGPTFGSRQFIPIVENGRLTIDPDGTGTLMTSTGQESRFVIQAVEQVRDGRLATRATGIPLDERPLTGGVVITEYKRLPDGELFEAASLKGNFAFVGEGFGGRRQTTAIGTVSFDGVGRVDVKFELNAPVPGDPCARAYTEFSETGTYRIDSNGFGSIAFPFSGPAEFLVTCAEPDPKGGMHVATEVIVVVRDLDPILGSLQVSQLSRISN